MRAPVTALCAILLATGAARAAPVDPACAMTPVLMEDFHVDDVATSRIGPAKWTAHTPWGGDFGDARFADPGPGSPFAFGPGGLSVTASKGPDGRWRSGLVAAADASGRGEGTRYGYFEARMRLPPGPGTWPAFWLAALRPVTPPVDGSVEVDVVEYYGKFDWGYHTVLHVWHADPRAGRGADHVVEVPPGSLVSGFHDYGVDVSPKWIVWMLDGVEVFRAPTPRELDGPLYPIVDLALGSGWPTTDTPNPSVLQVRHVRVWGRGPGPADGCPLGPPGAR